MKEEKERKTSSGLKFLINIFNKINKLIFVEKKYWCLGVKNYKINLIVENKFI